MIYQKFNVLITSRKKILTKNLEVYPNDHIPFINNAKNAQITLLKCFDKDGSDHNHDLNIENSVLTVICRDGIEDWIVNEGNSKITIKTNDKNDIFYSDETGKMKLEPGTTTYDSRLNDQAPSMLDKII